MKICIYISILLSFSLCFSCSDDVPVQNNTQKIDTMSATVSGVVSLDFFTTGVNISDMPKDGRMRKLVSGTMIKNQLAIYDIYFFLDFQTNDQTEFDLSGQEYLTRLEFDQGVIDKIIYGYNVSGKAIITKKTENEISGTFNFSATNADSSESVKIDNGYFVWRIK